MDSINKSSTPRITTPTATTSRHEAKKAYLQLKFIMKYSLRLASAAEKAEFLAAEELLKSELLRITTETISADLIQRRREKLEANSELKEIFSLFWLILSITTVDGILTKDDYVNFHLLLQLALIGDAIDEKEAKEIAEADYKYDTATFGDINEIVFFDIMSSTIEVWADMVSPQYLTAFAWALLATTVDIKAFPPKFHPKSSVKCITTVNSQQDILRKFSSDRQFRSNIQVKNEWLNAVNLRLEVQKRLSTRRAGHLVRDATPVFDMLKITEMNYHRKNGKAQDTSLGGSDSDDGSSVGGSSYLGDLPQLELSKKIRPTLLSPSGRSTMRAKESPPSSPTNEGIITVTGTRTSIFTTSDRGRLNKTTPLSSKNYLAARTNIPQNHITYGKGAYRKSLRKSISPGTSSDSMMSSPNAGLSAELHEWLAGVMNSNRSTVSNTSIDLASGRRTPDRPNSRGGTSSLSSLGPMEVRLTSFSPKPYGSSQSQLLSDDDGDGDGEGDGPLLPSSMAFNDSIESSEILYDTMKQPSSLTETMYPSYHTDDGNNSSLRCGISGSSWDPKRTKPFTRRRRKQQESLKLKISKEVAKSRAKYKIPDYVPEVTRGRNPLIPEEMRVIKTITATEEGVDIVNLLSESISIEKNKIKKLPTQQLTSPRRMNSSTPSGGTLKTGLCLVDAASSSTLNRLSISSPSLMLQSYSASRNISNDQNFFLTESPLMDNNQHSKTHTKHSPHNITTATKNTIIHDQKYFLDHSSDDKKGSLVMTDSLTPELYILSTTHPTLSQIGTLPAVTTTATHHQINKPIIQPHAAFPFSSYGPWIPKGGMGVMISDKSDPLLSWEENRDVKKYYPHDNTEMRTVLKRQQVIRNSFEGYSKQL